MGLEIVLLCYAAVAFGAYAVYYGAAAIYRGRVPLTSRRHLTGDSAKSAGCACMAAGLGLIALLICCLAAIDR